MKKRILALGLSFLLTFAACMPASAAEINPGPVNPEASGILQETADTSQQETATADNIKETAADSEPGEEKEPLTGEDSLGKEAETPQTETASSMPPDSTEMEDSSEITETVSEEDVLPDADESKEFEDSEKPVETSAPEETENLEGSAEPAESEASAATDDSGENTPADNNGIMPLSGVQLFWPVPGHTSLSQGFHDGNAIDISDGNIAGATVIAAIGGTVTSIYLCPDQHYGSTGDCNGFGTGLVINGDDGRVYQYAHMKAGSIPSNVYHGARVEAGQTIGAVGTTGNSSGNHLHFGISIGNYWNASGINPQYENYTYGGVSLTTSWNIYCSLADTTNAVIHGDITTNQSVQFTEAGAYVWDPDGNLVAQPSEGTTVSGTIMSIKYDMGMELGIWLNPGTTYTYQFWAKTGGNTYTSGVGSFSTTGDTPITHILLSPSQANMKAGEKLTLKAGITPAYANNKTLTWTSDNTAVATVSNGVVTAVKPGTAKITAKSHNGILGFCTITVQDDLASVKVNPSITGRAADALRLGWKKVAEADGYIIEQFKNGVWTRIARIAGNNTLTYRVEKLNPSTTYKFRMKAFKLDGDNASYSGYTAVSGKTNPSVVSGVKIGGRAADALRINWTKNPTASGYIIEQYKSGKWTRIARIANNTTTTYRVEKLSSSTTYQFRIQAFGSDGSTPLYGSYTTLSGTTLPNAVSGLKIGGTAYDALRLNWNGDAKASGYIIEQYKNGKWTRIARIGNNTTVTYRVEELSPSTTYQFRVQAFGFDGNTPLYSSYKQISGKTMTAVFKAPGAVKGVKIGGRAADTLRLNWNKSVNASGYIIEQYKNGKWTRIARIGSSSTLTYRVEKLTAATTYQFRIQSFGYSGSTPVYSSYTYINGKTNPGVVTGLRIGGTAKDALRLNWNKNSKASGYIIEQYKDGLWVRIARIGVNSTLTFRAENLNPSMAYVFRVQSFAYDQSTPIYSAWEYITGVTDK